MKINQETKKKVIDGLIQLTSSKDIFNLCVRVLTYTRSSRTPLDKQFN